MSLPPESIRLFLCGDVMTGRGIDQIMAHPSDPILYEPSITSAVDYVLLAEAAHGRIARQVSPDYVWGSALDELSRRQPDVRIINLETSITRSRSYVPKDINYRMSSRECRLSFGCRRSIAALSPTIMCSIGVVPDCWKLSTGWRN